jgi:hypothetical protein
MKKINLYSEGFTIILYFCLSVVFDKNPYFPISLISRYTKNFRAFKKTQKSIVEGKHWFITNNIIERIYFENDFEVPLMEPDPCFCLTDKAKRMLLSDVPFLFTTKTINKSKSEQTLPKGVIRYTEMAAKELFYNDSERPQVAQIEDALSGEMYRAVQERLKEKGMSVGIVCLFSGGPGTGKTETAMQIARKTGRHIMKVDLSTIRGKYVGESEKNIKAVFDSYRELLKKSNNVPILLFNEADGVIGKRLAISNGSANPTIAMMENTIQNIILDELENFTGILIATTNLTCNMDDAFERRFLYKVEFKKPGYKVRKSIWHSVMPELPEETVHALALEHHLSGAQIQNVVRKSVINYAVSGNDASLVSLKSLCYEEQSSKIVEKPIGFVA